MTTASENDATADLQPQSASPGPDPGDPTDDAVPVAGDHGSGAGDPRALVTDLSCLPAMRSYLDRIGAERRGMWSFAVSEPQGRYSFDRYSGRLAKGAQGFQLTGHAVEGEDASEFEPTDAERQAILFEADRAQWPEYLPPYSARNLPPTLKEADPENIFEFRTMPDAAGHSQIIMLQLRGDYGKSKYRPFTYWSDNQWRQLEPEGLLPLWGIDQLKKHSTVFLHEGAKAARAVRRLVEDTTWGAKDRLAAHPWGAELHYAAHIGWIGGALNPHRTDWSPLAKVDRIIIVADNDVPGKAAVPKIARALAAYPIKVEALLFDDSFPIGFDLADPFPKAMFK